MKNRRSRIHIYIIPIICITLIVFGLIITIVPTEKTQTADVRSTSSFVPRTTAVEKSEPEEVIEEITEQLDEVGLEPVTTASHLYPETSLLVSDEDDRPEDCTAEFHIEDFDDDGEIDLNLGLVSFTTHMTNEESLDENMFDGTFIHGDVDASGVVDSSTEVEDVDEAIEYIEETTDAACEKYVEYAEEVGIDEE